MAAAECILFCESEVTVSWNTPMHCSGKKEPSGWGTRCRRRHGMLPAELQWLSTKLQAVRQLKGAVWKPILPLVWACSSPSSQEHHLGSAGEAEAHSHRESYRNVACCSSSHLGARGKHTACLHSSHSWLGSEGGRGVNDPCCGIPSRSPRVKENNKQHPGMNLQPP